MNQQNWFITILKKMENSKNGPSKISRKKMLWLTGAVMIGITLILLGNIGQSPPPMNEKKMEAGPSPDTPQYKKTMMASEEDILAAKLQSMLESIDGAGSVRVTIRLASSSKESYAMNNTTGSKTTTEKDQGGGNRTINENSEASQLVMAKDEKGESPVVEMESASQVAGVLVVSSGAVNPKVKERLFEAVQVALNVEPHRIMVLNGK